MNLLLLDPNERLDAETFCVDGRKAQHIQAVLGKRPGDLIKLGLLNGKCGTGQILSSENNKIVIGQLELPHLPPAPAPIQLILAMPRPKVLGRILEAATELGVKQIVLINAAKVEKCYWSAHQLKVEHFEKHLIQGLELCKDTVVPEVRLERLFRPFIEDHLAQWLVNSRGIVADASGEDFPMLKAQISAPLCLAIGPEGGWTEFELRLFRQRDFSVMRFGERTLSCEAAVPAFISRLL